MNCLEFNRLRRLSNSKTCHCLQKSRFKFYPKKKKIGLLLLILWEIRAYGYGESVDY